MNSFLRFIFSILAVGILVNIVIVLLANAQSQRRDADQERRDHAAFAAMIEKVRDHVRRADIIVEAQRVDFRGKPLQTTLLARQYQSTGAEQTSPLPVQRIEIPGDRLAVTGVLLEFSPAFAADAPDYQFLRNARLVYVDRLCGEAEIAPESPDVRDPRFAFFPRGGPPDLTRLSPADLQPTPFERSIWQHIWERIELDEPRELSKLPVSAGVQGVKLTLLKPAAITVRRGAIYSAWVTPEGTVTLDENPSSMGGLIDAMIEDIQPKPAD